MDFELISAREKLEREQRERKQRAKLKLEREKKAKEAAIKQREAIEASQRSRRLDAIEAQIKLFESMWAIKQKDIAHKGMLEKHKVLERLLAIREKGEPLTELEIALKDKLINDMLNA